MVSKKNRKKELKNSIEEKELQLKKLSEHVDKSNVCGDLYNKVVLEKAILKKELDDLNKNKIVEAVKGVIPHKKELICDYFKGE